MCLAGSKFPEFVKTISEADKYMIFAISMSRIRQNNKNKFALLWGGVVFAFSLLKERKVFFIYYLGKG